MNDLMIWLHIHESFCYKQAWDDDDYFRYAYGSMRDIGVGLSTCNDNLVK